VSSARLVAHQFRYDMRSFLRNRQARVATLALPVVFLVLFVGVFHDYSVREHGADVASSTFYVPGVISLGIVSASFATLVVSVTVQRESSVLKRRRATPVPAWVLIAGRTLTSIAVALALAAVLIALARGAFGVRVRAEALPAVALTVVLGAAAFSCLGYALTTVIATADAAQPVVQAVLLPLYLISGVFIPSPDLPGWLDHVARIFPVERLADGMHQAFDPAVGGVAVPWRDLLVLVVWAIVGMRIAVKRFSWMPSAATE
jgi:ABC-2 type transport system permease protein